MTTPDVTQEIPQKPEVSAAKKGPAVETKFTGEIEQAAESARTIKSSLDKLQEGSQGVDLGEERQELEQLQSGLDQAELQAREQLAKGSAPQPELKKSEQSPQPNSEDSQEHKASEPKENKLSSKLKSIQADSRDRTQKISTLANLLSTKEKPALTPQGSVSFEAVSLEIDDLSEAQGLSNIEYIAKSAQVLATSAQLISQVKAEKEALQEKGYSTYRKIGDIENQLEELKSEGGLKGIAIALKRRRLIQQKVKLEKEFSDVEKQIQAKDTLDAQIRKKAEPIHIKQEKTLIDTATAEIKAIKNNYEQFLDEVLEDGTITQEMQEAYIATVITPMIDQAIGKQSEVSSEKKDAFYSLLRENLKHRINFTAPENYELRIALYRSIDEFRASGIKNACNDLLLLHGDVALLKKFVAKIATPDIITAITVTEQNLSYVYKYDFHPTEAITESDYNRREIYGNSGGNNANESLGRTILSELAANSDVYPDMSWWETLTSSSSANEIFGNLIKTEDDRIFVNALEKSLQDDRGRDIDILEHYPRPEAIRNLIVLAAADHKNYRTVHANGVLNTLAQRKNWGEILDQAEQVYPSLRSARSFLEKYAYSGFENNPGIQEAVNDFALDIFESKPVSTLTELAAESLTTDSILTILTKREVLSEQEEATLRETDTFLKQISEEAQKKHKEDDYSIPYISEYSFRNGLRENLLALLEQEARGSDEQRMAIVKRFETLSQAILENRNNYPALGYLTNESVINKIKDSSFKTDTFPIFLVAYQTCPALLTNNDLLGEFCRQFEGEQSVIFFKDMSVAYQNQKQQLNQIIVLVGKGALSKERALELPTKAKDVLSGAQFSLAMEFPQLFLGTADGVDFFTHANSASLFSLDRGLEMRIGERVRNLQRDGTLSFSELLAKIAPHEIEQIDKLLSSDSPVEANQQNWQQLLMGYVRAQSDIWGLPKLSQVSTDKINALFNDPKVRDLCLNGLRNSWSTYLKSGKPEEVPFSLNLTSEFINYCGGTGPLSQLESLNSLISSVNLAFAKETTAERTKSEIIQGIVAMEDRFIKERWSNEDRTDFNNISRDILGAAPSLFSDYLALFEKLTPSQMKSFAKYIYPLYRTKLVLMEKKDQKDNRTFDKEQLLYFRKDIRGFADIFNAGEKSFEVQKQKLLEELRGLFKNRFGVIKIPQEFTSEHMRSFTNVSTYLANLHGRTPDKETVLSFYLSLMINDRWDNFRRGEVVDPREYLTPEKSSIINRFLEERQRLNPLVPENLGITQEDVPEFLKLLQQETQNMVVGNIETIDVKLTNIILNLQGLEDLDLYPDALDKQRMQLLLDWGNKRVGSVVARMYQSLATPGKSIQFSEEDTKIQQQIARTIQELGLDLTPQTLKEHFQDGIKPLATVINLLNFVEDTRAEQEIETLRDLLKPSQEVIEVFRRLGEDFKPTSGAMALSQDLSYLDNLIVKREDELQPQEKALLTEYTTNVRTQMIKLEGLYSQIKNKFGGLKQGSNGSRNPLLQDKLDQIGKIVNAQTTQQAITSTTTNNLNVIIENIRECLSCTREGCNNDTDLTFGDMNKFYLYSQSETQQRGSISDQLVFVEPVTRADGSRETAFVLDRIYGTNTPTILENQIEAVLKKYRSIKQRFPTAKLSVFISDSAISTGGTSADMLLEKFKIKNISAEKETVEINVAESATGDHYIEFGGGARTAGKRQASGIVVSL